MSWTQKFRQGLGLHLLPKPVRRMVVAAIGGTLLLIGVALLVLPGPAFLVIPIGLLILTSEFAWARWLLRRAQNLFRKNDLEEPPADPRDAQSAEGTLSGSRRG